MAKFNKKLSEPSILVKPVSKFGGLDHIHIALMALAIILILLILIMSYNTKISIVNVTQGINCTYGSLNGTCLSPMHTAAQAKLAAEKVLAGYANSSSSLSLLPYFSNVNNATVSYSTGSRLWYVSIPYYSPVSSNTYTLGIVLQDSNLSKYQSFVQTQSPPAPSNNYVVSQGVIQLAGSTSCGAGPLQSYWFIDPYSPGAVQSLVNSTTLQNKYGPKLNITYKILYTPYSQQIANTYGLNNTLQLGKYILCGSIQSNFTGFVKSLNASFTNGYMPTYVLQGIASHSGFNMTSLSSCMASSQSVINAQALQAKYYNITSSSAVLTNCMYLSIPQTAQKALCLAGSLC